MLLLDFVFNFGELLPHMSKVIMEDPALDWDGSLKKKVGEYRCSHGESLDSVDVSDIARSSLPLWKDSLTVQWGAVIVLQADASFLKWGLRMKVFLPSPHVLSFIWLLQSWQFADEGDFCRASIFMEFAFCIFPSDKFKQVHLQSVWFHQFPHEKVGFDSVII